VPDPGRSYSRFAAATFSPVARASAFPMNGSRCQSPELPSVPSRSAFVLLARKYVLPSPLVHRLTCRPAVGFLALLLQGLAFSRAAQAHELEKPVPIKEVAPTWPASASTDHDVLVPLVLTISAEGGVTDVQVEASLGALFDEAAVAAARQWMFRPARHNGVPVAAKVRAYVRFPAHAATLDSGPRIPEASESHGSASASPPTDAATRLEPVKPLGHGEEQHHEVRVIGERTTAPRSASETTRGQEVIRAAPHRTGGDLLQIVPGAFITQHSGQGKAYQVFYRGFDAVHGQDLEFWVGGAPVNDVSNIHGQGYADLHFVMPEVVSRLTIQPANYSPEQGDFAVAGTIRYDLGYQEPGVAAKGTLGSFGERRVFLGYHRAGAAPGSFAAFESQSTDGFGRSRAASRTSAIAQQIIPLDSGQLRLLATGYAGRFDSPGVVSLRDIETGRVGRFDTYGIPQGGFSSRYQVVTEYREVEETSEFSVAPYFVQRGLELVQNYTGYLLDPQHGDTTQLVNESSTLGLTGHFRRALGWLSGHDSIEVGVSVRNDWIAQSQRDLAVGNARVLQTIVDAKVRALDAAGWFDLTLSPLTRLKLRAGLRLDHLAYRVQDNTPVDEARSGSDPNAFARTLRPVSTGGQVRTAMGAHYGPRASMDYVVARGTHAVVSYGEGFRSPQARSLGHGERTPFTRVRSMEAGLRYTTGAINASLSTFRTTLGNDLVFDAATARNEAVPASERLGGALEFVVKPNSWFVSSASGTYTRATFTQSDSFYRAGDKVPYAPELIVRQDLAFTPAFGKLAARPLTGRMGVALTGMFDRPQPYGRYGHDVFLVDAVAGLRLKELSVELNVLNLLDAKWYDSEFTYSANWNPGATARLVPERYVTVGAPRTVLWTLGVFID